MWWIPHATRNQRSRSQRNRKWKRTSRDKKSLSRTHNQLLINNGDNTRFYMLKSQVSPMDCLKSAESTCKTKLPVNRSLRVFLKSIFGDQTMALRNWENPFKLWRDQICQCSQFRWETLPCVIQRNFCFIPKCKSILTMGRKSRNRLHSWVASRSKKQGRLKLLTC